jgi:hypothetical protein
MSPGYSFGETKTSCDEHRGENREGLKILNCKRGEDCSGKKVIYDIDIFCGMKNVFKVPDDRIFF